MVRYQNLKRKPELFRAPLGPGTMYPLNSPLAGPGDSTTKILMNYEDTCPDRRHANVSLLYQNGLLYVLHLCQKNVQILRWKMHPACTCGASC